MYVATPTKKVVFAVFRAAMNQSGTIQFSPLLQKCILYFFSQSTIHRSSAAGMQSQSLSTFFGGNTDSKIANSTYWHILDNASSLFFLGAMRVAKCYTYSVFTYSLYHRLNSDKSLER